MNSTPSSATIAPTDSSMPPVRMTKACAIAMMPNSPIWLAVLEMFAGEQEARVDDRDDRADDQDQHQQADVLLEDHVGLRSFAISALGHRRPDGQPQDVVLAELRPLEAAR